MTILPALTFGFFLGLRHATDADHVAAVGTLASAGSAPRRAAMVGALWGVGHSLSVLLAGGVLILLRVPMPARLALALELCVAVMLVGLGIRALRTRAVATHVAPLRPLLIGVMHGLAGTAVLALMVLGTTSSALVAAVYLLCFAVGTVAGMALVTLLLSLPFQFGGIRHARVGRGLHLAAGAASVIVGVLLAHQVVVQDGLFAASLAWWR